MNGETVQNNFCKGRCRRCHKVLLNSGSIFTDSVWITLLLVHISLHLALPSPSLFMSMCSTKLYIRLPFLANCDRVR